MAKSTGGSTAQESSSGSGLMKAGRLVALSGIGSIVLGVLMLLWPGRTLVVMGVLLGLNLIVSGLSLIFSRVRAGEGVGHKILGIMGGVATVVIGLAVLRNPGLTLAVVTLLVGAAWLVSGLFEVIEGITDRDGEHRGLHIMGGLVTAVAGFVIFVAPLGTLLALAVWGGLLMIAVGVVRLVVAIRIHRSGRS